MSPARRCESRCQQPSVSSPNQYRFSTDQSAQTGVGSSADKPTEQTKIVPKAPSSFVFRKATVAAPVTSESLRTKLKQVQTTPVPQK